MTLGRFFPVEDFPPLTTLVANWELIGAELDALQVGLLDIDRAGKTHEEVISEITSHMRLGGQYGWLKGWGESGENRDWIQFGLMAGDAPIRWAESHCPTTLKLLRSVRGVRVAAFSRMRPSTFLATHRHPELRYFGLLQFHLTLRAPSKANYCYLNVDGEFRQHVEGEGFVFDGSRDHFAVNASSDDRTILYLEFDSSINRLRKP